MSDDEDRQRARLDACEESVVAAMVTAYTREVARMDEDGLVAKAMHARAVAAVTKAVAELPEQDRNVLRLRYEQERTLTTRPSSSASPTPPSRSATGAPSRHWASD